MAYSNFSNGISKLSPAQIYGDAGLIYIRYHAQSPTVRRISAALDRRSARSPNRLTTHLDLATTTLC